MAENNKSRVDDELDQILSDAAKIKNNKQEKDEQPNVKKDRSADRDSDRPRKDNRRPRPEGAKNTNRPRRSATETSEKGSQKNKRPRPVTSDDDNKNTRQPKKSSAAASTAAVRSSSGKPSGKKKKRKKNKFTKKQMVLLISGIIFLLLCIAGLIIYLVIHHYWSMTQHEWKDSVTSEKPILSSMEFPDASDTFNVEDAEEKLKHQLEENAVDIMKDKDVFNVLVIGQDLRSSSYEERGNTDVMILVSLNKKDKTFTMTSFMRDIWLYIPDCAYSSRLNAAYWAGGPDYLINTIETYFGVNIDRYVNVTFNSFIRAVDALGGIDIYVTPEEMMGRQDLTPYSDPHYRGMYFCLDEQNKILGNPKGTDYVTMSYDTPGEVLHLNGNQALAYARIRYIGNSDFERTERQRKVISKVIEKVRGASLSELNDLANAVLKDITTTITEGETFSLLLDALDYANYDIQEMRIPQDGTFSDHFISGNSVLLCNTVKNAQDLQMLIYGKTTVDEEQLKKFEMQNKYIDDYGNWVDWYS